MKFIAVDQEFWLIEKLWYQFLDITRILCERGN